MAMCSRQGISRIAEDAFATVLRETERLVSIRFWFGCVNSGISWTFVCTNCIYPLGSEDMRFWGRECRPKCHPSG